MPALTHDAPIGIFDSGFGGLTVARSVIDQLPHESIVYVGDTARQPYGSKPIGEVREYALECLDHLVEQGVKSLVIACNSASAAMLRDARERYDVPVVEVILPAARRAVAASRSGQIGVISLVMGDGVTLVSSAEECAKDVYKLLVRTDLMHEGGVPTYSFATTGSPDEFETIGRRFLGSELLGASQFAGGLS